MWTEVVKVRPKVDAADAAKMERDLSTRFVRAGKKFNKALTKFTSIALGGSVIGGIGLALINKILNPLEKVEARIKEILNQGQDTADTAEALGGTPAQLFQIQKVAESVSLKPEDLKKLIDQFKEKQLSARFELNNPDVDQHRSTQILGKEIATNENSIQAFIDFIKKLRGLNTNEQIIAERAVFGEKFTGAERRFRDLNFPAEASRIGVGNIAAVEEVIKRLNKIAELDSFQKANISTKAFLDQAKLISPEVVTRINTREALQQDKLTREMSNIGEYQKLQQSADKLANLLEGLTVQIGKLINKADTLGTSVLGSSEARKKVMERLDWSLSPGPYGY